MKKCNSCNIEFNTSSKYCPLCQNVLVGEAKDIQFPKNVRYQSNSLIQKLLLFGSIIIALIFGFVELLVTKKLTISTYVGLGLLTNYLVILLIIKHYQNIYKVFTNYGIFIVSLLLIWYFVTKIAIITNYIIPSVCLFELLSNLTIEVVLRKHKIFKTTKKFVVNILLLLLPIVLVLLNQTTNDIMAYICLLISIIALVGALIFSFNEIKEEFSKIFNI